MRKQSTTAESWKPAVQLALAFAAIKFAIEFIGNLLAQHFGYGIFRDEMYYIVCGRHLAWGYVDQAPMVALQAHVAEMLFGFRHLALFRSFSGLAGAAKVFLTGILAWQLGGRRIAQVMAMVAVLIAPVYLGIDSFLSMNSFEPVFWMGCMVVALLMVAGNSPKWWLTFGVLGGMGLLNKPSMAFFLVALLIGLLLTPQRRILWSRWTLAAVALIVVIALPYLLWQIHHQWPTLVWLNNVNHSHKNVKLGPLAFVGAQIMMLNPISIFLL
ncbi:MAG: glycosyltransferase family 39 protein, partial [Acidobacteriaceae bacterium]